MQVRSINHARTGRKKRPLASVYPSFLPYVSTRLPLDGFASNFMFETSVKICRECQNLVKIGQKISHTLREYLGVFFILDGDTCRPTAVKRYVIVAFAWQQHFYYCCWPRHTKLSKKNKFIVALTW